MPNVVRLERRSGMVSDLVPRLRRELIRALPDYGKHLGTDGKAIRSHSTGRTLKGKGRTSDPDADRGFHAHKGVNKRTGKPWEHISSWFGTSCTSSETPNTSSPWRSPWEGVSLRAEGADPGPDRPVQRRPGL